MLPALSARVIKERVVSQLRATEIVRTHRRQHGGLSYSIDYARLADYAYDLGFFPPDWVIDAARFQGTEIRMLDDSQSTQMGTSEVPKPVPPKYANEYFVQLKKNTKEEPKGDAQSVSVNESGYWE